MYYTISACFLQVHSSGDVLLRKSCTMSKKRVYGSEKRITFADRSLMMDWNPGLWKRFIGRVWKSSRSRAEALAMLFITHRDRPPVQKRKKEKMLSHHLCLERQRERGRTSPVLRDQDSAESVAAKAVYTFLSFIKRAFEQQQHYIWIAKACSDFCSFLLPGLLLVCWWLW